jgi:putative transposase
VKGRKRHILVDTMGLLLQVVVHPANVTDREGAKEVLAGIHERFPRLALIWADGGYRGEPVAWLAKECGITMAIVQREIQEYRIWPDARPITMRVGFQVLPRRWVVERTFGWWGRYRGLAKDYEQVPNSSEAMVLIAMIQVMLKRLAPA